ncbi:hypothetical protein H4R20_006444 [Coemansia guatemalensis]|uniref:Uncharacterized protein n=1 Tax=Coemansia guatemalensis TaxID=2761395 RepID=A0A9W8HTR2_9FUNG|nr:hypothetical protein H4R20_006444 [Coemansia guatemalensis]
MTIFSYNKYIICDKVALITGALGAIGKATSFRLANLGASLILVDILPECAGNEFCQSLIQRVSNASALYIQADLRNPRDIQRMLTEGAEAYSHIDILINNAGIALYKDYYHNEEREPIDMAIDINLRAPLESTRLFAKMLKDLRREGVVVNLSSITALVPGRFVEIYGATKVALMYFTKASAYLAPQIRIAAVAPFFVDSPMVNRSEVVKNIPSINQHTLLSPADVADAVVRQIEDRSSGGKTAMVVSGWGSLPTWHFGLSAVYALAMVHLWWLISVIRSFLMPNRHKTKQAIS